MSEVDHLSWVPSLTILTFVSFAMIATQGGIGASPLAIQKTLTLYGINEVSGLAFGWLLWSVQTIMLFDKVAMTYRDHVLTYDLNLPTWPFFAVAWMGDVCAVLLIGIRTWRLITEPQAFAADNKAGH